MSVIFNNIELTQTCVTQTCVIPEKLCLLTALVV